MSEGLVRKRGFRRAYATVVNTTASKGVSVRWERLPLTRTEVEAVLPDILSSVRAWIAKVNKLAQ